MISKDVKIGKNSKVWHNCNLYGCSIGSNTQVGSYTEIKTGAEVGDYCRMQGYVFIPEDTQIGNGVFIGPHVTFLNDKYPSSKGAISGNWKLQPVTVEDNVSIGGGSTILPGVKVGHNSAIGAGSNVTKDVSPYSVVVGNPARVIGDTRDKKYKQFLMEELE